MDHDDDTTSPERRPSERTWLLEDVESSSTKCNGNTPDDSSRVESGPEATPDDQVVVIEVSKKTAVGVMIVLWWGSLLFGLDTTSVAALTAPIASDFDSLPLLAWVASGYLIASAAILPPIGKLTDIFGRRAGLLVCNVLFTVGNLICGLAHTDAAMIAGRVVAGFGGGGMNAITTFVISDLIPLRSRGVWIGVGNVIYGVGAALGGPFSGWIHDAIGWRWVFIIFVPCSVLSTAGVFFAVRIPVAKSTVSKWRRIDFAGVITLISSLVLFLVALNAGGNTVPWNHPLIYITFPVAAAFFALFLYVEAYVAVEPSLPLRLMRDRTVAAGCLANWFGNMCYFGIMFYVPVYFQARGMSAFQAGIRLAPDSIGLALGSITVGLLMQATGRYWWLNAATEAFYVISFGLISTFDLNTPTAPPFVYMFLMGVGFTGMTGTTQTALIAAVEHRHQAVVTSASYAFRSTGQVVGIALCSLGFQNVLQASLWERFGDRADAEWLVPLVRDDLSHLFDLPLSLRAEATGAYMDAFRVVFVTTLCLSAATAVSSLSMREHKLHDTIARLPATESVPS